MPQQLSSPSTNCICVSCGKEFYASPSVLRQGQGKHCSMECRKKRIVVSCFNCGKEIIRNPSNCKGKRLYCSVECHREWDRKNLHGEIHPHWKGGITHKTRICIYCGGSFQTKHADGKFCCKDHKNKWTHENLHGDKHPSYKRIDTPCKQCGKNVQVTPARHKKTKSIFCSTVCRDTWTHEHPGKEHHQFTSKYVACIICGKEFKLTPHWEKLGRTKYCSQECYWKDLPNLIGGENHPNWIGGPKEYCEKWTTEFRRRIRLFYNNTCIECGNPQNGKLLHCHHVYYDKKACCSINENGIYLSNLGIKDAPHTFEIAGDPNKFVLLCDSCHMKSSSKKHRADWARYFESVVNNYYLGKSYLTKEEYDSLIAS